MSTATFAPSAADRAAYALCEHPTPGGQVLRIENRPGVSLAAGAPDMLLGVAVLKVGVFNGTVEVDRDDLDAYVARFDALRGVFRPPLRIDHSFDILSVIGRFVDLRVENRPDETIGGTIVPMLVGDVQLVGTPEENAQIKAWVASGKLDERSSELWPYRTNTGVEYPSVFSGCAFVDIPAVEGLGAITLRRATLSATDARGATMTDDAATETVEETAEDETTETETPEVGETPEAEPVEVPDEERIVIGDADEDADEEPDPAGEVPPSTGELAAALRQAGVNLSAAQLASIERVTQERVNLRVEADNRLTAFRSKGVLTPAIAPTVEVLLRHDDKAVRDGVAAILEAARPPVKLGDSTGVLFAVSPGAPAGDRATEVIHLSMERDEMLEAWNSLSASDRQKYRPELAAWQAANPTGA